MTDSGVVDGENVMNTDDKVDSLLILVTVFLFNITTLILSYNPPTEYCAQGRRRDHYCHYLTAFFQASRSAVLPFCILSAVLPFWERTAQWLNGRNENRNIIKL
jgi:hypothetical protein